MNLIYLIDCYVFGENKSEENELAKLNTHKNETNQEKFLSNVHKEIFIPYNPKLKIVLRTDLKHLECVYSVWLQLMCCICMSKFEISKAMKSVD